MPSTFWSSTSCSSPGSTRRMDGADLGGEQLDLVVAQRLGGRDHLAHLHEEAHDVGRGAVQLGAELLRGRRPLHHDLALGDRSVRGRVGGEVHRLELLTAPTPAAALAPRRALLRTAPTTAGPSTGTAAGTTAGAAAGAAHRTAGPTARGEPAPAGTTARARRPWAGRPTRRPGGRGWERPMGPRGRAGTTAAHAGRRRDRLAAVASGGAEAHRRWTAGPCRRPARPGPGARARRARPGPAAHSRLAPAGPAAGALRARPGPAAGSSARGARGLCGCRGGAGRRGCGRGGGPAPARRPTRRARGRRCRWR